MKLRQAVWPVRREIENLLIAKAGDGAQLSRTGAAADRGITLAGFGSYTF
jgi:hypothetical protein